MSLEVVFPVKKQRELEINSIKAVYNFLKEKDSLANKEKNALKNNDRYPQKISKQLKNLEKHFQKLQKDQYGLDYLFNEHNEEDYTANNDINALQEARKLFNERKSNLFCKETNEIRKKLHKKEAVYNFLKEKQQKDSLTN